MTSETLQALRRATGESHSRLDQTLDMPARLGDPADRKALVARFYGWQAGAERALDARLAQIEGLDLPLRRRAAGFARDLADLGGPHVADLPICPVAEPADEAEALGLLYVVEGSTLGGKVIRKMLAARGQSMNGLGFLDPYGEETGAMWRGVLAVLDREGSRSEAARAGIVRGGVQGFDQVEAWLCGARAPA